MYVIEGFGGVAWQRYLAQNRTGRLVVGPKRRVADLEAADGGTAFRTLGRALLSDDEQRLGGECMTAGGPPDGWEAEEKNF